MGIGDIRYTVLQTVNEVQRKLGLTATASLTTNSLAIQLVDFVNDVCNELSDCGNWQETMVSANVTAVAGQRDYTITTSANIKNIGDIYFITSSNTSGPLRHVTLEEMRSLTRSNATGVPRQFTAFETDSNGNPKLRTHPVATSAEHGGLFSLLFWQRPPQYTTADTATVIPFPARVMVLGVLAKQILNESGGAPTPRYQQTYQDYLLARKEALNRFAGDTGWNVSFRPSMSYRKR